jgi:hypothetical protein
MSCAPTLITISHSLPITVKDIATKREFQLDLLSQLLRLGLNDLNILSVFGASFWPAPKYLSFNLTPPRLSGYNARIAI